MIGTEELADVVITVTKTGVDVGTSVLTSVGDDPFDDVDHIRRGRACHGDRRCVGDGDEQHLRCGRQLDLLDGNRQRCVPHDELDLQRAWPGHVDDRCSRQHDAISVQLLGPGHARRPTQTARRPPTCTIPRATRSPQIDQNGVETQYVYNAYNRAHRGDRAIGHQSCDGRVGQPDVHLRLRHLRRPNSMTDAAATPRLYAYDPNGNMVSGDVADGADRVLAVQRRRASDRVHRLRWQRDGLRVLRHRVDLRRPGQLETKTVYAYTIWHALRDRHVRVQPKLQ